LLRALLLLPLLLRQSKWLLRLRRQWLLLLLLLLLLRLRLLRLRLRLRLLGQNGAAQGKS
jgi:hypothetical protein